jgi:hypothetical protein
MSPFDKQSRATSTLEGMRLETPSMLGYRAGMSSSCVIGHKLGAVFSVEQNLPREIDCAVRALHTKLGQTR